MQDFVHQQYQCGFAWGFGSRAQRLSRCYFDEKISRNPNSFCSISGSILWILVSLSPEFAPYSGFHRTATAVLGIAMSDSAPLGVWGL